MLNNFLSIPAAMPLLTLLRSKFLTYGTGNGNQTLQIKAPMIHQSMFMEGRKLIHPSSSFVPYPVCLGPPEASVFAEVDVLCL